MHHIAAGFVQLEPIEAEIALRWVTGVYDAAIAEIPSALSELKNDPYWKSITTMRTRLRGGGSILTLDQWNAFYGANIGTKSVIDHFTISTSVGDC